MSYRRLSPDELPRGHTRGVEWSDEQDEPRLQALGIPEEFAVCMRVSDGFAGMPAKVEECGLCHEPVWRSLRAAPMFILCGVCADEHTPWWKGKP